MVKITVCLGSSCHLKGSRQVVQDLQYLIGHHNLKDKIDLSGIFCMGQCQKGVCVTVDGDLHSVKPETTQTFFDEVIMPRVS